MTKQKAGLEKLIKSQDHHASLPAVLSEVVEIHVAIANGRKAFEDGDLVTHEEALKRLLKMSPDEQNESK